MADASLSRFDPDLAEFGELQRAFWRRVVVHGVPAAIAMLLCVCIIPAVLAGAPWWLVLPAAPAAAGAALQLMVLWLDRPTFSVKPTTVEIGAGVLRFVDDDTGTIEEVRWKRDAAISVRRANDAVEITLPSGRRSRVQWFAYENREQLLKELMSLEHANDKAPKPQAPGPASSPPPAEVQPAAAAPPKPEPTPKAPKAERSRREKQ